MPEEIRPLLAEAIERHKTEYGIGEFVVGHHGGFDRMAAHMVRKAKERHPDVRLILLRPYFPYKYMNELASEFDGSYCPPGMENVPKPFAIVRANEHMIKTCDYLIYYNKGFVGKTRDFVALARRIEEKGKIHIENLGGRA